MSHLSLELQLQELQRMAFPDRLSQIRKDRGLTQQALADDVGVHVTQLRRYEAGKAQPTLGVIRRIAIALRTSSDDLVFDDKDRRPDDDLKFQFEALAALDDDEKQVVISVLEGLLLKHQTQRVQALRPE